MGGGAGTHADREAERAVVGEGEATTVAREGRGDEANDRKWGKQTRGGAEEPSAQPPAQGRVPRRFLAGTSVGGKWLRGISDAKLACGVGALRQFLRTLTQSSRSTGRSRRTSSSRRAAEPIFFSICPP